MEIKKRKSSTPKQPTITPQQAATLMKRAYIKTRQAVERQTNSEYESAEQYAHDEAEYNTEHAAVDIAVAVKKAAETVCHRSVKCKDAINNPSVEETERASASSSIIKQKRTGETKIRKAKTATEKVIKTHTQAKFYLQNKSATIEAWQPSSASIKTINNAQRKSSAVSKAVSDTAFQAQYTKQRVKKAKEAAKKNAKSLKAAIKGAINAVKELVSVLFAGGWVALLIILMICMLGMIVGSAYGIFAGNEVSKATDGNTNRDLRSAVSTINSEYYQKIQSIRSGIENLENTTIYINGEVGAMAGVWQEVLAVYAVDTTLGDEATAAIDFDLGKTQKLRNIFWDMVSITYSVVERSVEKEQENSDEEGKVTTETVEVIYHDLKIYVKTKSTSQAATMYAFSDEQNKVLTELMSDSLTKAWSDLIYGYSYGDEDIVAVAISQIGNIGGEPYWRWYGLSSRTEWCAIFVSWCANQCGYIDAGVIPKFAWVSDAVSWFQARGQWQSGGYTPAPGDIIFFDWEGDGRANHVGIVEYVENSIIHTVEGNTGDACKRRQYDLHSSKILGYGLICT